MPTYVVRNVKERSILIAYAEDELALASIVGSLTDVALLQFEYRALTYGDTLISAALAREIDYSAVTDGVHDMYETLMLVSSNLLNSFGDDAGFKSFSHDAALVALWAGQDMDSH